MTRMRLGLLMLVVAGAACSGAAKREKSPSASCPPGGSDAPFAKVMNAAFAASYEGCSIRTTATFLNANSMLAANLGDPASVVFEVTSTGEGSVEIVKLPKSASDVVFTLKKGDPVILTGGPHAWPTGGAKSHYFEASSVTKAESSP